MTPADSLSLILRRLDEIERKLDRIMEELRALRNFDTGKLMSDDSQQ
jgi:tetrahydromethanopterin S-methyltransferase subunit G